LGVTPETNPSQLLSVSEALRLLSGQFSPLEAVQVPLASSAGRVLAEDIQSNLDLPPFPNSVMDGFAVKVEDLAEALPDQPVMLDVVADIPAGLPVDKQLQRGQAARIMTGAVIPAGAEAVIPVEDTNFNDRQSGSEAPKTVIAFRPVTLGENIRPAGQDVRSGEVVLRAGERLRPQDVGLLSMIGMANVPVRRKPRVAVFSTGDELTPVEHPLTPGKIHDANSYALTALAEMYGAQATNLGIVPDQPDAIQGCLDRAASEAVDMIISSAGVSVGALDFVRTVVEQNGRLDFWRVNMRPGKPLAFGYYKDVPFFGLPGNPVSAFVGFEVFVRQTLLKLQGAKRISRTVLKARLLEKVESDGRESYLRAKVTQGAGEWIAELTGHQGSGNLRSLVQGNALLIIPSGVKSVPSGAQVDFWMLDEEL